MALNKYSTTKKLQGHSTEWVPFASKTLQKKKSFSTFFKDWI